MPQDVGYGGKNKVAGDPKKQAVAGGTRKALPRNTITNKTKNPRRMRRGG